MGMDSIVQTVLLATAAFAGANVTDLFVLVLFFSKDKFKTREIVIGQYLGVGGLILVCLTVAVFGATFIPQEWTRFLGAVPIFVGLKNIFGKRDSDSEEIPKKMRGFLGAHTLEVASVAFADCSDNLAIFIPILFKNNSVEKGVTVVVFLALIGVWCAAAYYLTHHKRLGPSIKHYGQIVSPFVLIGLGAVILFA